MPSFILTKLAMPRLILCLAAKVIILMYDLCFFRLFRALLSDKECEWRHQLKDNKQNPHQPRPLRLLLIHTKQVYFEAHRKYRPLLQFGFLANRFLAPFDGSGDLLANSCMHKMKQAKSVSNIRTLAKSLEERLEITMPRGRVNCNIRNNERISSK